MSPGRALKSALMVLLASHSADAHKIAKIPDLTTYTGDGDNNGEAHWQKLNCWECFEAKGRYCSNLDTFTHKQKVGSNLGHGVCCKPGSTAEECKTDIKK